MSASRPAPALRRAALAVATALLVPARAAELLSGRLYTVPETVYVNQAFELHFELEVTPGAEVDDLNIRGVPNDPALLTLGRLETASRTRVARDGRDADVLHFKADARGHQPAEQQYRPVLSCLLVQRRASGFFSHWQSTPRTLALAPLTLRILPLPAEGRPDDFSGAVGLFRLRGRLAPETARPGDIVTLTLDLTGRGWLGEASLPSPPPSPLFKSYPPKTRLREPLRVQTEQLFVPLATNAVELAAVSFSYFNPASGAYERATAGPFRLTLTDAPADARPAELRVISTAGGDEAAGAAAVVIARVHEGKRLALPLLVAAAGALAAFFALFQLFGRRPRLALLLAALLLAAGGTGGRLLAGRRGAASRGVARTAEARFAPRGGSQPLFTVAAGSEVVPLETHGPWVRVDAAGRRGWLPADALERGAAPAP